MSILNKQDVKTEFEYREWRESPIWYCVKTVLHNITGKMESEIMVDEKTKIAIAIQSIDKPMDGTYETYEATTYYTYHHSYAEAARQLALSRI